MKSQLHQSDASLLIHMLPHNKLIRILKLLHGNQALIIEDDIRVDLKSHRYPGKRGFLQLQKCKNDEEAYKKDNQEKDSAGNNL